MHAPGGAASMIDPSIQHRTRDAKQVQIDVQCCCCYSFIYMLLIKIVPLLIALKFRLQLYEDRMNRWTATMLLLAGSTAVRVGVWWSRSITRWFSHLIVDNHSQDFFFPSHAMQCKTGVTASRLAQSGPPHLFAWFRAHSQPSLLDMCGLLVFFPKSLIYYLSQVSLLSWRVDSCFLNKFCTKIYSWSCCFLQNLITWSPGN